MLVQRRNRQWVVLLTAAMVPSCGGARFFAAETGGATGSAGMTASSSVQSTGATAGGGSSTGGAGGYGGTLRSGGVGTSAAGKGGATESGGGTSSGGLVSRGGVGGALAGPYCSAYIDLGAALVVSSVGSTAKTCYRSSAPAHIAGIDISNCNRALRINGQLIACPGSGSGQCLGPFPTASNDGYWYLEFSAGPRTYCSASWW